MPPQARLGGLRRRGIYLLPNLFTTGVLFCGFFAIVQAMNQRFEVGAIAIFVAMVLDGMDGRVARWTNTQSEFGAQFDSIADMVAFGAAPGPDRLHLGAEGPRHAGLDRRLHLLRRRRHPPRALQRQHHGRRQALFPGPAEPVGRGGDDRPGLGAGRLRLHAHRLARDLTWIVAVFAGVTMVSNVPFWSFKEVNWKKRVPLWVILVCVIAISVIASRPRSCCGRSSCRTRFSGYVMWAMGHRVRPVLP
jgi:CDP-diacylglycerol--serine O-phosphatidyltransferase